MDEEIERLVIGVRADTSGFTRDVDAMRQTLEGPFASGADRAGRAVETALSRAVRTGKLGFDDLRQVAVSTLGEIAASAVRTGLGSVVGSAGGGVAGGLVTGLLGLLGLPGRATGGPVSPGRGYVVGERGPELFVPTTSGSVVPSASSGRGARDVRVAITLNAATGSDAGGTPSALARSGKQVAQAVRRAIIDAG